MFVLSYLGFYQVSKFWGIGGCGGSVMVIIYSNIVVSDNFGSIGAVMRKWLKNDFGWFTPAFSITMSAPFMFCVLGCLMALCSV